MREAFEHALRKAVGADRNLVKRVKQALQRANARQRWKKSARR